MNIMMIHFLAELIEDKLEYNVSEILETKWLTIDQIKNMPKEEFRSYYVVENIINSIETKNLYGLEILRHLQNI